MKQKETEPTKPPETTEPIESKSSRSEATKADPAAAERIELLGEAGEPMRIDSFVARHTELTRSQAQRMIETGCVTLDGKPAAKNARVGEGRRVSVTLPPVRESEAAPEEIPLDIVYEDDDLLVVNKPKGMVVHPAPGNPGGTLVNALLAHCGTSLSGVGGVARPGIVHRIDKDTSGLLIVAKNDRAHRCLAAQIKAHSFTREYEAVVHGVFKDDCGTVDAPIGRHPVKRKQMAVTQTGSKPAVTHYRVLARYRGFTHVRLRLETGRTHQIRVHMAYLGHPVAGDPVYGPKRPVPGLQGQCLHAKRIGFVHPDGRTLDFESDLPDYFTDFLRRLAEKDEEL